jgi:ABC-type nitrate/sulfonate/bicarbonate transport system permease component
MRYSNQLHTSRRHNILKNKKKSSIISAAWIILALCILGVVVNFAKIDLPVFLEGFVVSLFRVSAAYLIALVIACVLALVITSNQRIENLTLPFFDVMQSFPSFALFPVLVASIHSPEVIIISVLALEVIWPVLFTIIGGVKNRREDLEEAATIYGATGFKRLIHFSLPELAPAIVTGSIVGWGEAWEFIIGAELLVNAHIGVGSYLGQLGNGQQNLLLALGILSLMILLFLINKLLWLPLLNKTTKYQTES